MRHSWRTANVAKLVNAPGLNPGGPCGHEGSTPFVRTNRQRQTVARAPSSPAEPG